MDFSISNETMPSVPDTDELSNAINTAFHAAETLVETFIAQLLDAPSHIIPLISPIILLIVIVSIS